jgi:hypothetical protein
MSSAAFPYTGIALFNNFIEGDEKIIAIEFFANSLPTYLISFQLNVN